MNTKHLSGVIIVFVLFLAVLSAGCLSQQETIREETYADQLDAAKNLTKNISMQINSIDDALITAAETIANDKYNETLVYQTFDDVYLNYQAVEAFIVIDENNRIVSVCPAEYPAAFAEDMVTGLSLNYSAGSPMITTATFAYDDRAVMANILPMISEDGTQQGVLTAVIDPSLFYEAIVYNFQLETGYNAWIIDENGKILYYPDRSFANSNIMQLESPDQTELERVLQAIMQKKSGVETYTAYSYGKLKLTSQAAAWDTVVTTNNRNHEPTVVVTSEIAISSQSIYPAASANIELQDFVYSAYLFAEQNGFDAALEEFNNPEGRFTTREYYITAFDMNGTLLASPYLPESVGRNWTSITDKNGVHIAQAYKYRANQGGGYVTNLYPYPSTGDEYVRISYVQPVDENWYILSGEYHPEINAEVSPKMRMEMILYAREIAEFIENTDPKTAFARLNDGLYDRDDMEMVVGTYNGTIAAHGFDTSLVGKDIMGSTDIYGASIGREVVIFAKDGGGFRYVNLPMPDESTDLSLAYVQPISNEYFVMITLPFHEIR